jgi:signal peptidase I
MQQNDSIQGPSQPLNPQNPTPNTVDEPLITVGGPEDPKKEGWRSMLSTIMILIAAPVVALFLINFVFQSYEVDGPSMETTLQNHDRLIVDKIPRSLSRISRKSYVPKRGEIVIFSKSGLFEFGSSDEKQLIKRVIGVPGDRVVVADGKITIYNKQYPNGYNPDANVSWSAAIKTTPGTVDVTVQDGEVFVCGDNRTNSLDSRYFGTVSSSEIVGKLSFRIFPINKADSF